MYDVNYIDNIKAENEQMMAMPSQGSYDDFEATSQR